MAFAMSRGTRAKTDRIDAELITQFMLFHPEAGRTLPNDNLPSAPDFRGAYNYVSDVVKTNFLLSMAQPCE
jgi:hypothetical protein